MAKIALVNKLSANDINKAMFALPNYTGFKLVHGRSLMDAQWMRYSQVAARKEFSHPLQQAALSNFCGSACRAIASDKRLRFCRICLSVGFQSSIFQIDGLQRCPIHGELLCDTCERCGKPAPRYAIEASSFENPMHCIHCGGSFSDAWTYRGMVLYWSIPVNRRILGRAASWLYKIASLPVPDAESEAFDGLPDVDCRRNSFDFLRRLVPLELPWLQSPDITVIMGPTPSKMPREGKEEQLNERKKIYGSMRRHYRRALKIPKLLNAESTNLDMEGDRNYAIYSLNGVSPELHGFILWRSRFEQEFWPLSYRSSPSRSALGTKLAFSPDHNLPEDNSTWAHLVHFCLLQDLHQAHIWADKMKCLGYLNTDARNMVRDELFFDDGSDMYPWKGALPRGVGLVELNNSVVVFRIRNPYVARNANHLINRD